MIGKSTGNWASLALLFAFISNITDVRAEGCKAYEDNNLYPSTLEMIIESMKERVRPEDLMTFKGLRQLQLQMNVTGFSPMEYEIALQIPVSETESRTIVVPADQLTQMGAVTYDLNPFRTPWMNLHIATDPKQSIDIPYNFLVQFDKSNPIQGVFIPKNITNFVSYTAMARDPKKIKGIKAEFEPLVAQNLKDQSKIMVNGKESPIRALNEMLIIARLQEPVFNSAVNNNIKTGAWVKLEEGTTLDVIPQISRGLTFLRVFSKSIGYSPKVRAMLERVQIEFLTRYINEYQIGKSYGGRNVQEAFSVPVGGRFYLSTDASEAEALSYSAGVTVNGIYISNLAISHTSPTKVSSGGHNLAYQVEDPIPAGKFLLWPVLVTSEELPPPPEPPKSSYDEGDDG